MKALKQALMIVGALLAIMASVFISFAKDLPGGIIGIIATAVVFGFLGVLDKVGTRLVEKVEGEVAASQVETAPSGESDLAGIGWPLKWLVRLMICFVAISLTVFFSFFPILGAFGLLSIGGFVNTLLSIGAFVVALVPPVVGFYVVRANWNWHEGTHSEIQSGRLS